jgi:signal transduction histidine kinase
VSVIDRLRPRSLRARFSLLAVLIAGVLVTLLGSAFLLVLHTRLESSSHDALRGRLAAAADLVVVGNDGRLTATSALLDEGAWVLEGARVVARAPGPPELQAAVAARAGTTGFTDGPHEMLLLAEPLPGEGTLVGALSLKANSDAVDLVQLLVVVIGLGVMVATWFATHLLVGRALRPVVGLTRQAADWSATDVSRRFGDADRPTELADLAATLDGVLDRISAVLRHEQQLTAELSHELRTPLARIVAEVELLESRPRSPTELTAAHTAIAAGAARMDVILQTLLSTARSGADVPPGRCAAAETMRAVLAAYDDPRLVLAGQEVVVGVDAHVLERILVPLVDNALRYARTSVVLRTGPGPVVSVVDDGPGLDEGLLETVFDPGRRAAPGDGHHGAGLGLALSRRLARAAGGDVVLSRRADLPGLVATVSLQGG